MMYTVYVLRLEGKKKVYIGVTQNIDERIRTHERGHVRSTRGKAPRLFYTETFESKTDAWKREKWLKSGAGRVWLRQRFDLAW